MKETVFTGNAHEGTLQTFDEGALGLLSQPHEMMRLAEFLVRALRA